MLDTIYIGLSGLGSYSRGLKTISNNVANLNTPGFKASSLRFGDLIYQGRRDGAGNARTGSGVTTFGSSTDFSAGDFRNTGNGLDVAINGRGFFVLRDEQGNLRYTRDGQFHFNGNGDLVASSNGLKVLAYDTNGNLVPVNANGYQTHAPKASTQITLAGNLSSGDDAHVVDNVNVYDSTGAAHALKLAFGNKQIDAATNTITWTVTVTEGATNLGTGTMKFQNGLPVAGDSTVNISFAPQGGAASSLAISPGTDVTGYSLGAESTLAVKTADGYASGSVATQALDAQGKLSIGYSNGQSAQPFQLALARFQSMEGLEQVGGNLFATHVGTAVQIDRTGAAGDSLVAQSVEISNVDLSQEFGDLIVQQRGFQASSQIVSTANEMLQQLFEMKGSR